MPVSIVYYPDPILKRRAPPLLVIDEEARERVREMFAILYRERGVGLAAPQVGWSVRLFIANPTGEADPAEERVYINPRITAAEGEVREEEGCLSIPDVRGMVTRSRWVGVRAQDLNGQFFEEEAEELKARVIQHELDHLDGILFLSRLSSADRLLVKKELKRLESRYAERTARA
jgi:peptide deformylase